MFQLRYNKIEGLVPVSWEMYEQYNEQYSIGASVEYTLAKYNEVKRVVPVPEEKHLQYSREVWVQYTVSPPPFL